MSTASENPAPAGNSRNAMHLLRGTVSLVFMAHAVVRLVNGSAPQFARFLESRGFAWGTGWVAAISACEIVCGLLLLFGIAVRLACTLLASIVIMGIALIHVHNGWFVGEHGTGGMELSVLLCAALLAIACNAPGRHPAWLWEMAQRQGRGGSGSGPAA